MQFVANYGAASYMSQIPQLDMFCSLSKCAHTFKSGKLGDFKKGEEYYLLGLKIDPNHNGINEYLGELYFVTNRVDLAKERLSVLKSCNCEEYKDLKEIIEGKKQSKY